MHAVAAIFSSRHHGFRAFDDTATGRTQEPFRGGADVILKSSDAPAPRRDARCEARVRGPGREPIVTSNPGVGRPSVHLARRSPRRRDMPSRGRRAGAPANRRRPP